MRVRQGALCGSYLALLSFFPFGALATDDCKPVKDPIAGSVNQGNYEFEYESWEGKNCRHYLIRNKPGKPLTPVKWAYGDTVYIDTNLPACKPNQVCQPAEKVDRSYISNQSKTMIGFGIDKDEYLEKPAAVVESNLTASLVHSFGEQSTILAGTIADAQGQPVSIALAFNPEAYTANGRWVIRFKASQSKGASIEPIEVIWSEGSKTYFIQRLDPGDQSTWRFVTGRADANGTGGTNAVLTMKQGGKVIASTTTPSPLGASDQAIK
jgi:hypothetical protein